MWYREINFARHMKRFYQENVDAYIMIHKSLSQDIEAAVLGVFEV